MIQVHARSSIIRAAEWERKRQNTSRLFRVNRYDCVPPTSHELQIDVSTEARSTGKDVEDDFRLCVSDLDLALADLRGVSD